MPEPPVVRVERMESGSSGIRLTLHLPPHVAKEIRAADVLVVDPQRPWVFFNVSMFRRQRHFEDVPGKWLEEKFPQLEGAVRAGTVLAQLLDGSASTGEITDKILKKSIPPVALPLEAGRTYGQTLRAVQRILQKHEAMGWVRRLDLYRRGQVWELNGTVVYQMLYEEHRPFGNLGEQRERQKEKSVRQGQWRASGSHLVCPRCKVQLDKQNASNISYWLCPRCHFIHPADDSLALCGD